MVIDVYSHYFKITLDEFNFFSKIVTILNSFLKRNIHWDREKEGHGKDSIVKNVIRARFFITCNGSKEYRIHINQLGDFLQELHNENYKDFTINYHDANDITFPIINTNLKPNYVLRPLQEEALAYCLKPNKYPAKLVELQTGEGKSIVSMVTASRLKSRFVMIIRAQYLEKWYQDLLDAMEISPEEIYVVQGKDKLVEVFQLGLNNKLDGIKAILISNKTFQPFLSQYEQYGTEGIYELGYSITPDKYCEVLGARVVLVDEGHQDFHLNYKIHLYTHTQLSVTTTATLVPDDPFLKKMARIIYPEHLRFKPEDQAGYIQYRALFYRFWNPSYIRTKTYKGYSHVMFENSIIKHVPTKRHYFAMIASIIDKEYINFIEGKDKSKFKVIVFCSLVKTCTELTEYLQDRYKTLDVRRYIGADPYENLIEPDIRVTTPGSAGTAVNVPDLYLGINTVAMGSSTQSKQTIGRLRRRKDNIQPIFYETYSLDIPNHDNFYSKKKYQFSDKVAFFNYFNYDKNI